MITRLHWRTAKNSVMIGLTGMAAIAATIPLLLIMWHILREGAQAIDLEFFRSIPAPIGEEGGGVAHAIVGSLIIVGVASGVGLPIGIGAGLYLAERGASKLASVVRFLADVLNGLPSIVMGIFAWQILVRPVGHFSAVSAGLALGAMMIPMVTRTTEEMIRLVPNSLREAALALGYSRWRTSLRIVLLTAMPGIVTGALVSVSRIAGETAPLLFTALGNSWFSTSLSEPIAALPLQIYIFASSPSDNWNTQAWGAALVLIAMILFVSILARVVTRSRFGGGAGD